jgi:hypothetical protein|nr:hypothetical protein [Kofleriaceae bacterium]
MAAARLGLALLSVCIASTVAAADGFDPHTVDYIEDPYAPHVTNGTEARLGSMVGYYDGQRQNVLAVGAVAAVGHRFGRLTLEAELAALTLESTTEADATIGNAERLGVVARYDVIRLGPHWVGPNSLLAIYVEGGAARAWNHWYRPDAGDPSDLSADTTRVVPDDSARVEGIVGFGLMLDHRLQEPIAFPHRIGWFLGWRMAYAPHASEPAVECRGVSCSPAPAMPDDTYVDRSMLFQSSLSVTW